MSGESVEELESHTRKELDEIGESLGLRSTDYPNKRSIAEAILKARKEQRERETMEKERERGGIRREEAPVEELKKKMTKDTVKGKIATIRLTAEKMRDDVTGMLQDGVSKLKAGMTEMQRGIQEQANENVQAIARFKGGVREILKGVRAVQSCIKEQVTENRKAAATFHSGVQELLSSVQEQMKDNREAWVAMQSGVKEMQESIREMQISINDQIAESQTYIREFYG